ncbi:MAG: hypothetical protein ACRCZZ_00340 [Phocaeicola sp.]
MRCFKTQSIFGSLNDLLTNNKTLTITRRLGLVGVFLLVINRGALAVD